FDLDHVRPEVRQHGRRRRAGDEAGQVHDLQAGEYAINAHGLLLIVGAIVNRFGLCHRPWNFGLRFARNAATPSFMSSVATHWARKDASMFSPSARLTSRPRLAASIASFTATGALAPILARMASAREMRSAAGTTSFTRPI